jgi:hypothetical protein
MYTFPKISHAFALMYLSNTKLEDLTEKFIEYKAHI